MYQVNFSEVLCCEKRVSVSVSVLVCGEKSVLVCGEKSVGV